MFGAHAQTYLLGDPNDNYTIFEEIIFKAKAKHLQPKTVRFKRYKHKLSPWMTKAILISIKMRDKLFCKLKSTPEISTHYADLEHNLSEYKKLLKKIIRLAKTKYYAEQFDKNKANSRHVWATIKDILNRNKSKKESPSYFTLGEAIIKEPQSVANHFNEFFAGVGPRLSSEIPHNGTKSVSTYLKQAIMTSFTFDCVSDSTVMSVIKTLATKNSTGIDSISSHMLQKLAPSIITPLTHIINQSLCTGIFPHRLKIAKVIPLFKKNDPHIFDNYRPISLLSSISKTFEKVVFNQVYEYFTNNELFYNSQYGFRKLHSTEYASLELVDRISQYLDNGKLPVTVYLDLSKAFDTINHEILLKNLEYYGFTDTPLKWFRSYLHNRQQYVFFNGCCSTPKTLETGVPQGSILGPLLFLIYMNDIKEACKKFIPILYADDTGLVSSLCSFYDDKDKYDINEISRDINDELSCVQEWLNINKLSLNVSKTKYMIFHHRQRNIDEFIPDIRINDSPIERVTDFNFLGLQIDQHLNWNAHIQKSSNKISRTLGVMNRLKRYLPTKILRVLYNSLILPHLQYGILSWGFKLSRLSKLQKRAIRVITCSKFNAHTEPLFKSLNLLKLEDMVSFNVLKLYYKLCHGNLPVYVTNLFTRNAPGATHNYDLRPSGIFKTPTVHTCIAERCIRFMLPKIINDADPSVTEKADTHSFQGFTKYLKVTKIHSYATHCLIANCYICQNS